MNKNLVTLSKATHEERRHEWLLLLHSKATLTYNPSHNTLRLSTERNVIISDNYGIYELQHKLPAT